MIDSSGVKYWDPAGKKEAVANPGALDNGSWRNRTDANAGTATVTYITGGAGGPVNPAGGNWTTWARKKWTVAAKPAMSRNGFDIYNGPAAADADWIPVKPGAETTVSVWVRVVGAYPRTIKLSLIASTGLALGSTQMALTSNVWQELKFTAVIPGGIGFARAICESATVAQGGTVWAVNDQFDVTGLAVTTGPWITVARGPKGPVGLKGPTGPTLAPIVSFANRNLTIDGSPTTTPVDSVFVLKDLSARPGEVSTPIAPTSYGYDFVNQTPWAYWVNVWFTTTSLITDTTHISIWRENNTDGAGAWSELVRRLGPHSETNWGVSGVFPRMTGQDRLVIRGYSFKALPNYKAWMTISPIGPIYK